MKKIFFLLIFLFLLIFIFGFLFLDKTDHDKINEKPIQTNISPKITNFTASFAIYTNRTFRIFTDSRYYNLSEEIYIESQNPNVIHIKNANLTWDDFFKTLPMTLQKDCIITGTKQTFCTNENFVLQFYINGKRDQNALRKKINPNDKLLVTYEIENATVISEQLQSIPNAE